MHTDAAHFTPVVPAAEDQLARHDALGEDAALVVDVLQEQIDRGEPLREPALERGPTRAPVTMRGSRSKGKIRSVPCSSP